MTINFFNETVNVLKDNCYDISDVSYVVLSPNYKTSFESFCKIASDINYENESTDNHINTNVKVVLNDGNFLARTTTYNIETGYDVEHWELIINNPIEYAPENKAFLENLIYC